LHFQLRDGDRAVAEIDRPSANQPHQRKLAETITGYDRPEHEDAASLGAKTWALTHNKLWTSDEHKAAEQRSKPHCQ